MQNLFYLPVRQEKMRKKGIHISYILIAAFFSFSCNTSYQPQSLQYKSYQVEPSLPKDTTAGSLLWSYSQQVHKTMNEVVGMVEKTMDKKSPESEMGNFFADALLAMAREKYNTQVDAAFINFGGLRLTQLTAGPVTTGKIFEIMPFDNILILQKIKGAELQKFLDLTAGRDGWPLAGMSMQIKNKKAVNITIGGQPLDPAATYTIANSDFIANGGDNADMLRVIPQISNGYLMRDAFIDYIKKLKSQGKNISARLDNRVSYAQ